MLEIEFVDRSVALAGKAFVSFFPLVIVVAAFVPATVRTSIFGTLTHGLGMSGEALVVARRAFASADDVRRATGVVGLVLTCFFASSFTTAMQRVYLRAWRRPPGGAGNSARRGPTWLAVMLAYMAIVGGLRSQVEPHVGMAVFAVIAMSCSVALWWFTPWFLLLGHVRPRVLLPTALITGLLTSVYGVAASVWMPTVVARNETQYGFFGVALALTTWFSGAAMCVLLGACAGPVLAEGDGWIGSTIRGVEPDLLVSGAPPSLPGPLRAFHLRDAFRQTIDDGEPSSDDR